MSEVVMLVVKSFAGGEYKISMHDTGPEMDPSGMYRTIFETPQGRIHSYYLPMKRKREWRWRLAHDTAMIAKIGLDLTTAEIIVPARKEELWPVPQPYRHCGSLFALWGIGPRDRWRIRRKGPSLWGIGPRDRWRIRRKGPSFRGNG